MLSYLILNVNKGAIKMSTFIDSSIKKLIKKLELDKKFLKLLSQLQISLKKIHHQIDKDMYLII